MSKLYPILSERNSHDRDKNVVFDEPTHKYTIFPDIDSKYTSVTTWNQYIFPQYLLFSFQFLPFIIFFITLSALKLGKCV